MDHDSWNQVTFSYPNEIPTMISQEEKNYLYWLGQSFWKGLGSVIEIGPWLGGSTASLAAGMKASGRDCREQLHTYDNFIWRDFMAERAFLPIKAGESFHTFFLENIKDYEGIVKSYIRALPDEIIMSDEQASSTRFIESEHIPIFEGVAQEQVEILFVDGAKSWRGMKHLLNVINIHLVPGKSYLVCQDYKYWGAYWVPIMMSRLGKYLKPVHNTLTGTTVTFQLVSKIPTIFIESLEDHVKAMHTDESLQNIEQASLLLTEDGDALGAMNLLLSKISFLSHQGHFNRAVEEFTKIQKTWPIALNIGQLERAREYLQNEKGIDISRPIQLQLFYYGQSMLRRVRKIKHFIKAKGLFTSNY